MRRLLGLLAALTVPLLFGVPASAQTAADELGMQVVVGYGGVDGGSLWQPVEVHLSPTRPVAGTLTVTSSAFTGTRTAVDVPIEVAAASREVHRVLVPSGTIGIRIFEDGRDPISVRAPRPADTNDFVVGVLGQVPAGTPPVRSEPTGLSGRWVAVAPEWIEQSHLAMSPLSTLVATGTALEGLSPTGRENLAVAVTSGMDLVIAAEGAGEVAVGQLGLASVQAVTAQPDGGLAGPSGAWEITAADVGEAGDGVLAVVQPAGYGRVAVTSSMPAGDGDGGAMWSALVSPRASTGRGETSFSATRTPYQFPRLVAEQQSGHGPRLPWLGAFVIAYVLVVGPVNGIVLARSRRRELAWATVPIVTIVFTVGGFFGATGGRPPTGSAARLVMWTDGAATEFVAAGVRSNRPSQKTITFAGSEWTVRPLLDGPEPPRVGRGADVTASMELTALQLGGVAAWRTIDAPAPLQVEARVAAADRIDVTVTNVGSRALSQVCVEVAGLEEALDDLPPGATETVEINALDLPQQPAFEDPSMDMDPTGMGAGEIAPRSLDAVITETTLRRPGVIWAIGTEVGAPAAPASEGGVGLKNLGSLVAVGAPLQSGPDLPLSPFGVTRDLVLTSRGGEAMQSAPNSVEGAGEAFLRLRLPPGAQNAALSNQLDRGGAGGHIELTVWDHQKRVWMNVDRAIPTDGQAAAGVIGPSGEVWVRATGELFPFEFSARSVAGGVQ